MQRFWLLWQPLILSQENKRKWPVRAVKLNLS